MLASLEKEATDFSYLLAFEQSKNEQLLVKNLSSFNKQVGWQTELEDIIRHPGIAEVHLKKSTTLANRSKN